MQYGGACTLLSSGRYVVLTYPDSVTDLGLCSAEVYLAQAPAQELDQQQLSASSDGGHEGDSAGAIAGAVVGGVVGVAGELLLHDLHDLHDLLGFLLGVPGGGFS